MTDREDAAVERHEIERRGLADRHARARLAVGRLERLRREQGEDVGEEKLLVLLLVIDAELDQLCRLARKLAVAEPHQGVVDEGAIGAHLIAGWSRQEATLGPRVTRAHALVIGVEAIFEALVEHAVAGQEALQQEGLEEPGGVREMPLGRASIVHRLDDLVLVAQWRRQLARQRAGRHQAAAQRS